MLADADPLLRRVRRLAGPLGVRRKTAVDGECPDPVAERRLGTLYYVLWYTGLPVTRTVQARLDQRAESDLALLRSETGNDSEAIRLALRESAQQRRRRSALRAEAESAAADADDLAESRRVREDMDLVAAPWPET